MTAILGGGIAGMLAAYAFTEHQPRLIEAGPKLGGNFLAGGLKYLHDTRAMRKLLTDLGLTFGPRKPEGRIHHFGELRFHPEYLQACDPEVRRTIQAAHWRKTRQVETDETMLDKCMNDPMGSHAALECDLGLFIDRLADWTHANADVRLGKPIVEVRQTQAPGALITVKDDYGDSTVYAQRVITTLPLPVLAKVMSGIPSPTVTKLILVKFAIPVYQQARRWDYIYTPDCFFTSRIYWGDNEIVAEVPTNHSRPEMLLSDEDVIRQITTEARRATRIELCPVAISTIPGHLRPLSGPLALPPGVVALGRFAAWDSRATADKVLDQALSLKRDWYGPESAVG